MPSGYDYDYDYRSPTTSFSPSYNLQVETCIPAAASRRIGWRPLRACDDVSHATKQWRSSTLRYRSAFLAKSTLLCDELDDASAAASATRLLSLLWYFWHLVSWNTTPFAVQMNASDLDRCSSAADRRPLTISGGYDLSTCCCCCCCCCCWWCCTACTSVNVGSWSIAFAAKDEHGRRLLAE